MQLGLLKNIYINNIYKTIVLNKVVMGVPKTYVLDQQTCRARVAHVSLGVARRCLRCRACVAQVSLCVAGVHKNSENAQNYGLSTKNGCDTVKNLIVIFCTETLTILQALR